MRLYKHADPDYSGPGSPQCEEEEGEDTEFDSNVSSDGGEDLASLDGGKDLLSGEAQKKEGERERRDVLSGDLKSSSGVVSVRGDSDIVAAVTAAGRATAGPDDDEGPDGGVVGTVGNTVSGNGDTAGTQDSISGTSREESAGVAGGVRASSEETSTAARNSSPPPPPTPSETPQLPAAIQTQHAVTSQQPQRRQRRATALAAAESFGSQNASTSSPSPPPTGVTADSDGGVDQGGGGNGRGLGVGVEESKSSGNPMEALLWEAEDGGQTGTQSGGAAARVSSGGAGRGDEAEAEVDADADAEFVFREEADDEATLDAEVCFEGAITARCVAWCEKL